LDLSKEFASIDAELERLRVRKTKLEGELKELVDAIAAGAASEFECGNLATARKSYAASWTARISRGKAR